MSVVDKMKIHKLSITFGIAGIFIIIASTIRWFFLYPDYSQFVLAGGIGVVCIGFAYIHETIKGIDKQIEKFNDNEKEQELKFDKALDALNIYYHNEIDKLKKEVGK